MLASIEEVVKTNPRLGEEWRIIRDTLEFSTLKNVTERFSGIRNSWSHPDTSISGFDGIKDGVWHRLAFFNTDASVASSAVHFIQEGTRFATELENWNKVRTLDPVIMAALELITCPEDGAYVFIYPLEGDSLMDFYTLATPPSILSQDKTVMCKLVAQQTTNVLKVALERNICPPRMFSSDIFVSVFRPLDSSPAHQVVVRIVPWVVQKFDTDTIDYSPLRVVLSSAGFTQMSADLVVHDRLWGVLLALACILLGDKWFHIFNRGLYDTAIQMYINSMQSQHPVDTEETFMRRLNPIKLQTMYEAIIQPKHKWWRITKTNSATKAFPEVFSVLTHHFYAFNEPAAASVTLNACISQFS